jgi:pimeloyl-ACP methyl ester carboxylesterase
MIALLPGGLELAYDDAGAGIALLMLHGWPHDRTLWAGQVSGLSSDARCIAPDLRGFGGSTVNGPYTIDQYADDVAAFLDVLGIERAVVCGLSMGGYVAFALLRRHRARVRALILADTRATADDDAARDKRRELIALARTKGSEAVAARMIAGMVGKSTRARSPALVEQVRHMLAAAPEDGVVAALEAMMTRPDATPLLPTITVPTLVVVGAEDVLAPERDARAMQAAIPGSRLEVVAGAGHPRPLGHRRVT